MTDVKRIESYGLYDFCQDIEAAFKEGYVFDFDTNENFPTAFGTVFTCGLVKLVAQEVEVKGKEVEETTEVTETEEAVTQTEQTAEVEQNEQQSTENEAPEETAEVKEPAKRGPKPKNK